MYLFDKSLALFYLLVLGLCGIPLSFFLFRKDSQYTKFEKIIFGYFFGLTILGFLFMLELIIGLKFAPFLIYINWLVIFLAGIGLWIYKLKKEKVSIFSIFKFGFENKENIFVKIILFICMMILFWNAYSVSAIPSMDLDPYYYLEGVKQVVYSGYNYYNDLSAWYNPTATNKTISSHSGQPIWKYTLAAQFSLYNNNQEYNPYTLIGTASIYPPIIGMLVVFISFVLFKELYSEKVGLLIAGIVAFLPISISKFYGGDFQIEPNNVLALFSLFYAITYFLKRKTNFETLSIIFIIFLAVIFSSNIGGLANLIILTMLIVALVADYLSNAKKIEPQKIFYLALILIGIDILNSLYYYRSGFPFELSSLKDLIYPLVLIFYYGLTKIQENKQFFSFVKKYEKDFYSRLFFLIAIVMVLLIGFALIYQINPIKKIIQYNFLLGYLGAGGYENALLRTIAEQNIADPSYASEIGFYGEDYGFVQKDLSYKLNLLNGSDLVSQFNNFRRAFMYVLAYPSFVLNLFYLVFVNLMNALLAQNAYEYSPKNISLLTMAIFVAILATSIKFLYLAIKRKNWEFDILPIAVIFIMLLISLGKQKYSMYVAFLGIISLGIAIGCLVQLINYIIKRYGVLMLRNLIIGLISAVGLIALIISPSSIFLGIFIIALMDLGVFVFFQYFYDYKNEIAYLIIIFLILLEFAPEDILNFGGLLNPAQNPQNPIWGSFGFSSIHLFKNSFIERVYDNPKKIIPILLKECQNKQTTMCSTLEKILNGQDKDINPVYYYNNEVCLNSILLQLPEKERFNPSADKRMAYLFRCSMIAPYWLDSMYWISKNTPKDARIISWWDYGHWINFFGQRGSVLRNEHASLEMIGRTAAAFLHEDNEFLRQTMNQYHSQYALIDIEIVGSGSDKNHISLGGKYHALNYLGCDWLNQTNVSNYPGTSKCEIEHLWERVIIPKPYQECVISEQKKLNGVVGYLLEYQNGKEVATPTYCFTQEYGPYGEMIVGYLLNEKNSQGELRQKRANWIAADVGNDQVYLFALYTKEPVWKDENGSLVSGWEDRTTKYYDSNLYSAFFFDEMKGFDLVYNTPQIRIFKIKDEYYKPA